MSNEKTTILYRPVGRKELDLIKESGFKRFPPRLFHQPIFYPVLYNIVGTIEVTREFKKSQSNGLQS